MSTQASTNESSLQPYGFNIEQWRRRVPACERLVLMNNCSQTPQTDHTRMAAERYLESWSREVMDWDRWEDEVDALKADFAAFINASPDEIATLTSVSEATAVLISALPLKDRKKVVLTEAEFPCVAHIILAHGRYGLEPAWVPIRDEIIHAEDYVPLIDESTSPGLGHTRLLPERLRVQDIAAIAKKAHDKGAFLFVDAYQSSGIVPIDVKAMDADFPADRHTQVDVWRAGDRLSSMPKELLPLLEPAHMGWFGRTDVFAFDPKLLDWHPTAKRLETGTLAGTRRVHRPRWPGGHHGSGCREHTKLHTDSVRTHHRAGPAPGPHPVRDRRCHSQDPYHIVHVPGRIACGTGPDAQHGVNAPGTRPRDSTGPHFYNLPEECDYAVDALAQVYKEPELLASTPAIDHIRAHTGGHHCGRRP